MLKYCAQLSQYQELKEKDGDIPHFTAKFYGLLRTLMARKGLMMRSTFLWKISSIHLKLTVKKRDEDKLSQFHGAQFLLAWNMMIASSIRKLSIAMFWVQNVTLIVSSYLHLLQIQLQSELLDDEGTNEFEGDAGNQLAIDGSELINFKGVDFSDVIEGVEEEEEEDLHEDGHSEENSEASSQETPIAEYSRNGLHSSVLTGEEAPIPEEHVSRSESISQSSVEGTMLLTDSLLDVHTMNDRPATSSQSDRNAESGDIVWKDVMEEDDMGMEPGLVFFSVG
jgi:hypothetical protein